MENSIKKLKELFKSIPERHFTSAFIYNNGTISLTADYSDELKSLCENYKPLIRQYITPTNHQFMTEDVKLTITLTKPDNDIS